MFLQQKNRDDFDSYISRTKQITRGRFALANTDASRSSTRARARAEHARAQASVQAMSAAVHRVTARSRSHDDDDDADQDEDTLERDVYGRDPADVAEDDCRDEP